MKKALILLALLASTTALASMQAAGQSSISKISGGSREARACEVLRKKMSKSPDANTWQNRMRAWPCRRRPDIARVAAAGTAS